MQNPRRRTFAIISASILASTALVWGAVTNQNFFPDPNWNNANCPYGQCGQLQITLPPYNPYTPYPTWPGYATPTFAPSSTFQYVVTKIPTRDAGQTSTVGPFQPTTTPQNTPTLVPTFVTNATPTDIPIPTIATYDPVGTATIDPSTPIPTNPEPTDRPTPTPFPTATFVPTWTPAPATPITTPTPWVIVLVTNTPTPTP